MGVVEIEAAAALYSSARLEEVRPFALVDRLVELWMTGGLPIGPTSPESRRLDRYWLDRGDRLTDTERAEIYERVLGPRFDELWRPLLAALAGPGDEVAALASALRAHLGAHVDETSLAAAPRIVAHLREALDILDAREILQAYGAADLWQLVVSLARMELGTEPDVRRVQTQAAAGATVIAWLANGADVANDEVADAARSWLSVAVPPPA